MDHGGRRRWSAGHPCERPRGGRRKPPRKRLSGRSRRAGRCPGAGWGAACLRFPRCPAGPWRTILRVVSSRVASTRRSDGRSETAASAFSVTSIDQAGIPGFPCIQPPWSTHHPHRRRLHHESPTHRRSAPGRGARLRVARPRPGEARGRHLGAFDQRRRHHARRRAERAGVGASPNPRSSAMATTAASRAAASSTRAARSSGTAPTPRSSSWSPATTCTCRRWCGTVRSAGTPTSTAWTASSCR